MLQKGLGAPQYHFRRDLVAKYANGSRKSSRRRSSGWQINSYSGGGGSGGGPTYPRDGQNGPDGPRGKEPHGWCMAVVAGLAVAWLNPDEASALDTPKIATATYLAQRPDGADHGMPNEVAFGDDTTGDVAPPGGDLGSSGSSGHNSGDAISRLKRLQRELFAGMVDVRRRLEELEEAGQATAAGEAEGDDHFIPHEGAGVPLL